jgi:hypothetical protein
MTVLDAFTDNNNEYQLRDFKAIVEPTEELLQLHKQRNTFIEDIFNRLLIM